MTAQIINFPGQIYRFADMRRSHDVRLREIFRGKTKSQVRHMWDNLGPDDCYGEYDINDIHAYLNLIGDGAYCAV